MANVKASFILPLLNCCEAAREKFKACIKLFWFVCIITCVVRAQRRVLLLRRRRRLRRRLRRFRLVDDDFRDFRLVFIWILSSGIRMGFL